MSEKQTKATEPEAIPNWVKKAPELLPVWDWWVKEGRSWLTTLIIVGLVAGGVMAGKNWYKSREAAANQALVNSFTADELEEAVEKYGSSKVGPALKLRLAKRYYDAEQYEEAGKIYSDYIAAAKSDDPFSAIAVLGSAYVLEGEKKYDEAAKTYDSIAADTNLCTAAAAKLGAIRCKALLGDKSGALAELDKMGDDARAKSLAEAIKRYDPNRKSASLFDAADAAALKIDAEKKAESKPTEAKPAEAKK